MERLTERNPLWIDDELWGSACEPDDEEVDGVYRKLKEYEDADEQGLLLRLPCKPNSEVFLICSRYTHCSFEDVPFEESSCEGCEHGCDSRKELYIHRNESVGIEWIARNLNKFGKTVFLTRDEAESKLAEMEE